MTQYYRINNNNNNNRSNNIENVHSVFNVNIWSDMSCLVWIQSISQSLLYFIKYV